MEVGNRRREAEPQAVARTRPAVLEPDEPLQDLGVQVRGNSRPVVRYPGLDRAIEVSSRDLNMGIAGTVPDGILHEVGEQLRQQLPISCNDDTRIEGELELLTFLLGGAAIHLDHRVEDLRQIKGREGGPARATFDLGNAQEGCEHGQNIVDFMARGGEVLPQRLRIRIRSHRVFELLA